MAPQMLRVAHTHLRATQQQLEGEKRKAAIARKEGHHAVIVAERAKQGAQKMAEAFKRDTEKTVVRQLTVQRKAMEKELRHARFDTSHTMHVPHPPRSSHATHHPRNHTHAMPPTWRGTHATHTAHTPHTQHPASPGSSRKHSKKQIARPSKKRCGHLTQLIPAHLPYTLYTRRPPLLAMLSLILHE